MRSDNRRIREGMQMLVEMALILLSYWIAVSFRFSVLRGSVHLNFLGPELVGIIVGYAFVIVLCMYCLKLYRLRPGLRSAEQYQWVWLVNGVGVVALSAVLFMRRMMDFSRVLLLVFWLLSCALITAERLLLGLARRRFQGRHPHRVAIVGNGHLALQFVDDIRNNPQTGYTLVGYFSAVQKDGLGRCLGSYEDMERVLQETDVDEVVIALEPHEVQFMPRVFAALDKEGLRASLIPFFNDYYPTHPVMENLDRTTLIDMRATPLDNLFAAAFKRGCDIVGSVLLIVLTSPLMLITAIGVKVSSPGPILFRQERIGKDKKPFRMLKFRSMRVTGTEQTGWTKDNDPRKTRFGSFIRKFSIDELPQLFNVLAGDMSLIGPRPEVPYHVKIFREEIPRYLVRQQIRPGMTGWAQVNGLRGDTSIRDRVQYDIYYIENWSVLLDAYILLRTAFGGMVNSEQIEGGTGKKEKN